MIEMGAVVQRSKQDEHRLMKTFLANQQFVTVVNRHGGFVILRLCLLVPSCLALVFVTAFTSAT